jgi:SAM-dependent methyltransferase
MAGSVLKRGSSSLVDRALEVHWQHCSPPIGALAASAAERAPLEIRVIDGTADRLPVGDGSFDAGVASLVLCSVPDQASALAELRRVIRPGGELRFFEHVRADTRVLARVQRIVDPVWPLFGGGCHASRDTLAAIVVAGFEIEWLQRFRFPDGRLVSPTAPHALGAARRAGGARRPGGGNAAEATAG